MLDILLFTHDVAYGSRALAAGAAGVVIDWEYSEKPQRQRGYDTEVNRGTADDLRQMRQASSGRVICRINNEPGRRASEAVQAVDLGADEVWLPMVRRIAEVEDCLRAIDGRAALGVLVETCEAMQLGRALSELPLARAYVGLNDYRIDSGNVGLFDALIDGSVQRFRDDYSGCFGVAGVTRTDGGRPVPQRLLLGEMARLDCGFAVGRRSFRAETPADALAATLLDIRAQYLRLRARDRRACERDRALLIDCVGSLLAAGPSPCAC